MHVEQIKTASLRRIVLSSRFQKSLHFTCARRRPVTLAAAFGMESSLLRRLSHSMASTSSAEPPLSARCQLSHRLAGGRSRQGSAGRSGVEHCRRYDLLRPLLNPAPVAPPHAPLAIQDAEHVLRPFADGRRAAGGLSAQLKLQSGRNRQHQQPATMQRRCGDR